MTEQQLPFQRHSETSKEAAGKASSRAPGDRWRVFLAIARNGFAGIADHEVQAELGLQGSTQRPRRIELFNAGLIYDSGERVNTESGRAAVRWTTTAKGANLYTRFMLGDDTSNEFNALFKRKQPSPHVA